MGNTRLHPATAAAYRAAGWKFSAMGRIDAGTVTGPCAKCSTPTVRYGPAGQPLCVACREVPRG